MPKETAAYSIKAQIWSNVLKDKGIIVIYIMNRWWTRNFLIFAWLDSVSYSYIKQSGLTFIYEALQYHKNISSLNETVVKIIHLSVIFQLAKANKFGEIYSDSHR